MPGKSCCQICWESVDKVKREVDVMYDFAEAFETVPTGTKEEAG